MNKKNNYLIFCLCFLFSVAVHAQEKEEKNLSDYLGLNGYVKSLHTSSFTGSSDIRNNNWIHNRINLHVYPSAPLELAVEMRNRVFYGNSLQSTPYAANSLGEDHGLVDMSFLPIDEPSILFHSKIDRAYALYRGEKFDLTAGRQRINWGVNLVWNPNDLFNTYNFADFDYEERPGSDALRFQYYTDGMNSVEVAVKPGKNDSDWVAAGMYKLNIRGYDFQLIGGRYYEDYVIGTGWAGNIKNAGFKGELSYFHPEINFEDTSGVISTSVTFDYSLNNGVYLNGSVLFNSNGIDNPSLLSAGRAFSSITAKNLMPSKWSGFAQVSGAFTPILSGSFSVIYSPGINLMFVMPSVSYSISNEWDIMLLGQSYYAENMQAEFKNLTNIIFLRLKWSY